MAEKPVSQECLDDILNGWIYSTAFLFARATDFDRNGKPFSSILDPDKNIGGYAYVPGSILRFKGYVISTTHNKPFTHGEILLLMSESREYREFAYWKPRGNLHHRYTLVVDPPHSDEHYFAYFNGSFSGNGTFTMEIDYGNNSLTRQQINSLMNKIYRETEIFDR